MNIDCTAVFGAPIIEGNEETPIGQQAYQLGT
jgi:hypothetical protein